MEAAKDYAIFMLDSQGHVLTWNAGARAIKGYAAEEVVGRHFSMFFTTEDVDAGVPQRELSTALRCGHAETEGWRVRKDRRSSDASSERWPSGALSRTGLNSSSPKVR